jgi:hypothetical protein
MPRENEAKKGEKNLIKARQNLDSGPIWKNLPGLLASANHTILLDNTQITIQYC